MIMGSVHRWKIRTILIKAFFGLTEGEKINRRFRFSYTNPRRLIH